VTPLTTIEDFLVLGKDLADPECLVRKDEVRVARNRDGIVVVGLKDGSEFTTLTTLAAIIEQLTPPEGK
jgi:hypothetical protein